MVVHITNIIGCSILIDRGWRRSGTLLYKPDVRRACCPHYTIRLPAASFEPARSQRQVLHKWNRFVLGADYEKGAAKLHPKTKQDKNKSRNEFDLLDTVHLSEYDNVKRPPEPEHKFFVTLEHDDFSEEKFQLYSNYQSNVHKEPSSKISKSGFKRFLCDSPLVRARGEDNRHEMGSFHQCYRLDGRLIAMAVLDLLPHAVSGVYFIYHHDFEIWNLGKLSALREAALALERGCYYMMGFYIHSCVKMRYKGDYKPQYLLDPETYEWHLLDDTMKATLSAEKYFSANKNALRNTLNKEVVAPEETEGPGSDETAQASRKELSSFTSGMPGVLSLEDIGRQVELDDVLLAVGRTKKQIVPAAMLVNWEESSINNPHSLKGIVAELVACTGPEVASEMIVSLS